MDEKSYELTADTLQTKIYDNKLIVKLLRYLKPYKMLVVLSVLLLVVLTAIELTLPLILKTAIDEHIVPSRNMIVFDDRDDFDRFLSNNPESRLEIYEYEDNFYLIFPTDSKHYFDSDDLERLEEKEQLLPLNYFLIANEPQNKEILAGLQYSVLSEDLIAVSQKTVEALDTDQRHILRQRSRHAVVVFGILFLALVVGRLFFQFFQIYVTQIFAQRAMFDLREDAFAHLEKMPLSFFDKNPIGRLVTRVTTDIRALDELLSQGLVRIMQDFFILFGIVFVMLYLNWRLALVTYTIVPFVLILVKHFKVKTRIIYREVRKRVAMLNAALGEDVSGIRIVKLFNQYYYKCKQFGAINQKYFEASMAQLKLFALFRPLISISRHIAVAIILWYGGGQILRNAISLGMLMAFIRYMERFFEPINSLSEKFNILQRAMSGAERVFDLLEKKPEDYREDLTKDIAFKGEIEFKNVWLTYKIDDENLQLSQPQNESSSENGYPAGSTFACSSQEPEDQEDKPQDDFVLRDISFKVKPGEKVALVGHTGSGKTSIINLIAEMYPYQRGEILIDGRNKKQYSVKDIRRNIGIVQQDVFLFSGNIRDNIVLNNKDMPEEEMLRIAKYVNVDYFVSKLLHKYDEPVMERGATLSVGQRQLIAFARVLAYNPSIFILDEATSNIDTETELLIQDALKKVMAKRTSIIIAHRLSTIQHVDRIIVLHKGRIIEQGHHNDLIANRNLYYDLYRLQYA